MRPLLTLALLLLATLPAQAVLYKWVDQNGKVHYSDQPPPDSAKKSNVINVPRPATPAPAPAGDTANAPARGPKSAAEQEMEFRKRRLEAAEAEAKQQKDVQATEEKKRNCTQATNRVAALQAGGRITKYGPNGETIYLSDDQIASELAQARQVADSWCK